MIFTSTFFLVVFFPTVIGLHLILPSKFRNIFLIIASLFFYAWGETYYVIILLVSICFNFYLTRFMAFTSDKNKTRRLLVITVSLNLGLLCFFKYSNFFVDNLNSILTAMKIPAVHLSPVHLPIGISFFTFQALSYVIDVYKHKIAAQQRFMSIFLYISLFPQLIAGPIIRYRDIAEEISGRFISLDKFTYGIRRFVIGMGKKMILANPMGEVADTVFSLSSNELTAPVAWFGIACYTLQIYFDFSGYSDMAIGLGRVLGFTYIENFNYPYISRSIREFWRRWHISLSSWFRDYLYIPLGGSHCSASRVQMNLWIVFLLCGLWHGSSWNFIIWGGIHGLFMALERSGLEFVLKKMGRLIGHCYTLLVVMIAWVFFRAETLSGATGYLSVMFGLGNGQTPADILMHLFTQEKKMLFIIGILGILNWKEIFSLLKGKMRFNMSHTIDFSPAFFSYGAQTIHGLVLIFIFILSLMHLAIDTYNPFLYFRF